MYVCMYVCTCMYVHVCRYVCILVYYIHCSHEDEDGDGKELMIGLDGYCTAGERSRTECIQDYRQLLHTSMWGVCVCVCVRVYVCVCMYICMYVSKA